MRKTLFMVITLVLLVSIVPVFADSDDAAQTLVKYGIIKGDGKSLMEDQILKRQHAAIILCRMMGVEEEAKKADAKNLKFKDLQGRLNTENARIIAYTVDKGWFKGMSAERFGWGEDITVQQFSTILLRALRYDPDYSEALKIANELGLFKGTKKLIGSDPIVRSDVYVGMVNTLNSLPLGSLDSLIDILGLDKFNGTQPGAISDFYVTSVDTIGRKFIKVELSKPVFMPSLHFSHISVTDEDGYSAIEYRDHYMFTRVPLNTLNFELEIPYTVSGKNLHLKIEGLVDNDGHKIRPYEQDIVVGQKYDHEVTDVEIINPRIIRVTTNKPIDGQRQGYYSSHPGILIDGTPIIAKIQKYENYENEIDITLQSALTPGPHTIVISDIFDYEGLEVVRYRGKINVIADNEAPYVTKVDVLDSRTLRVLFNERILETKLGEFEVNYQNIKPEEGDYLVNRYDDRYGRYLLLRLDKQHQLTPEHIQEVKFVYRLQEDFAGNQSNLYHNFPVQALDDPSVPEAKVIYVRGQDVYIKFSKPMDKDADNEWVIAYPNGEEIQRGKLYNYMFNQFDIDDKTVIRLIVPSLIGREPADYELSLNGWRDTSVYHRVMPDTTLKLRGTDTVPPQVVGVNQLPNKYKINASNDEVEIVFNESMIIDNLRNKRLYMVYNSSNDGFVDNLNDIQGGAVITVLSDKKVRINFPGPTMLEAPNTYRYFKFAPSSSNFNYYDTMYDKVGNSFDPNIHITVFEQ